MTEITVKLAETDADIDAARALCREWMAWHWDAYPKDWPVRGNPMEPERFLKILDELPALHARPRGGILLASIDEVPCGCVMYNEAGPDIAEFNRMFVSEAGRGHGLGGLLLAHMFDQMIADGYKRVFFSSARFLTHARAMYERAGFVDMPHPADFPDAWRDYVYFMERKLV